MYVNSECIGPGGFDEDCQTVRRSRAVTIIFPVWDEPGPFNCLDFAQIVRCKILSVLSICPIVRTDTFAVCEFLRGSSYFTELGSRNENSWLSRAALQSQSKATSLSAESKLSNLLPFTVRDSHGHSEKWGSSSEKVDC